MKYLNLEFEFISNHGKESITLEERKKFRNITDGEISITLHHLECFKKITDEDEYILILEDDVLLHKNFNQILETYIKQLPEDWDMLFIGNGCNMHIDASLLIKDKYIYKSDPSDRGEKGLGATRCLDSYLITKKCARLILEKFQQPNYTLLCPADLWLNFVIRNNNLNVYWSEPTIVTQGSENGVYKSSLR
jgi:glycosyl transferase family 25